MAAPAARMLQGYFFKNACKVPPPFALVCAGGHHFIAQRSPPGPLHSKPCGTKNVRTAFGFQPLPGGAALRAAGKAQAAQKRNPAKNIGGIARRGVCFRGNAFLRLRPPGRLIPHRKKKGAARRRAGATQAVRNIVAPLFVILSHTPQHRYGIMCPPGGHRPFVLRHLPACITHLRRFS